MSRKGENIYKRKDGRWEGRYVKSKSPSGKTQYGYVYAKTYRDAKEKLRKAFASHSQQSIPPTTNIVLMGILLLVMTCLEIFTMYYNRIVLIFTLLLLVQILCSLSTIYMKFTVPERKATKAELSL